MSMIAGSCRFCGQLLEEIFADLGMSPLANAFISPDRAFAMEKFYPLRAYVCGACRLVQLGQFETPEQIFTEYLYFSSYSESWLRHAEAYVQTVIERFGIDMHSEVIELGSNDGYLLQYFCRKNVKVLGIEPAGNTAAVAIAKGIPTEIAFFGRRTAIQLKSMGRAPHLIVANNVLAHVPDLNDFVAGMNILLAPTGIITVEFPHLLKLIEEHQFDTIYHEHFSYFSFLTAEKIFAHHGLTVFDVDEIPTHGGSLRLYIRKIESFGCSFSPAVAALRQRESIALLASPEPYRRFSLEVAARKYEILEFLIGARRAEKKVIAYGAPAKGNTLLNYCGIGPDLIPFTVDASPHKQGMFLPGTHLPIREPAALIEAKPDYVFLLPWNLRDEIMTQLASIREWGGAFVVPIPNLRVLA